MNWARFLYTVVLLALLPVVFLRLLWRAKANPAYRQRWRERFLGSIPDTSIDDRPVICLHAVSVGETMAARPLIEALLAEYPQHRLWITSTTPTGSATVKRLFGDRVGHSYLPYDFPFAVNGFLARLQPRVLLVMETEIWPNLFAACAQRSIPLLMINARLSARSFKAYQRLPFLVAPALSHADAILTRSQVDADYFCQLGAPSERVKVAGNIKFLVQADDELVAKGKQLRSQWNRTAVWCAASTHSGEDERLLAVHWRLRQHIPDLLLVLVPRHPERFDTVAGLCAQYDSSFVRRSSGRALSGDSAILLGDSMGEMMMWFAASDVAFIGGSLVAVGGHNPLEALCVAVPVLSGTHISNFTDIYPVLEHAACTRLVATDDELHNYSLAWLQNPAERHTAGTAGQRFLQENNRVLEILMATISQSMTHGKIRIK